MSKGVYIFQGGTDTMISMMRDELIKNGVDIQMQARVEKILVENKRAHGVVVKGHTIYGRSVVSNSNIKSRFSFDGE